MSVFVPVSQYFDYCSFVVSFEVQKSNFVPFFKIFLCIWGASLVAQRLKRLPGMRETWVRSLSQEDPLEKEMAAHSSTLAWRIPWREEPGKLQSMGSQRVGHNWAVSLSLLRFHMDFSIFKNLCKNMGFWQITLNLQISFGIDILTVLGFSIYKYGMYFYLFVPSVISTVFCSFKW